jgi:glycosyltransferase involved in cell wall biosynthesis
MIDKKGQPLRILALTSMFPYPHEPTNGIFIKRQIEAIKKIGFDIRVIRPIPFIPKTISQHIPNRKWKSYGEIPDQGQMDGIHIYYLRYFVLPFRWFSIFSPFTQFLSLCKVIPRIIKEFAPSIFHSFNAIPEGYAGLLVSRRNGWKHICSLRGSDINVYPFQSYLNLRLTQAVIRKSDQILSVSWALKEQALTFAEPKREIRVIHNGCDLCLFHRNEDSRISVRKSLGIPDRSWCLVYVGHLKVKKGVIDLLRIFKVLKDNKFPLYLIVIGEGEDRKKMEIEIDRASVRKLVFLMGTIQQETIPYFLSASDIFLFPSHQEGLPNALLEAMACELPVVASRVGGIPEIVREGVDGLLIKPGDIEGFVHATEILLSDGILRSKMGRTGRERVQEKFSWSRGAEEIGKVYQDLLN